MWIRRTALVLATGMLALAGCAQLGTGSAENDAPMADEAAIRQAGAARDAAFAALDAAGVAAFYDADALLMPEAAKVARGSAAIRSFLDVYTKLLRDDGYKLVVAAEVEIEVSGPLAIRSGTYSIADKAGATADTGKWLEAWRKTDGSWRIVRDIRNSDMLTLFAPMAYTEGNNKDE